MDMMDMSKECADKLEFGHSSMIAYRVIPLELEKIRIF
jgi:hypothetical protein